MDDCVLPVDFRLVLVDLHRAGRRRIHPGAFVGLRLVLVDHRVLPVDFRLVRPYLYSSAIVVQGIRLLLGQ